MLLKDDKKSMASLIISKMGKPGEKTEQVEEPAKDSSVGLESAAEDMLSAFESKDAAGLVSALKAFLEMCEEPEEPEQY
jgi:hypothetical protein